MCLGVSSCLLSLLPFFPKIYYHVLYVLHYKDDTGLKDDENMREFKKFLRFSLIPGMEKSERFIAS